MDHNKYVNLWHKGQEDFKKIDHNKNIFTNNTNLVFQKEIGSGGALTYIVNKNNFDLFKRFNNSNEVYLFSEYKDNNIPLNVHCIIFRDYIEILKPSIQILELNDKIEYIDSDYKTILENNIKNKIYEYSYMIYEKLKNLKYIGFLGIDFIYSNNELFFIEINPRFQGSTRYLDRILQENNFKSIYEYNYNAFYNIETQQIKKYFYE
jgi:predicted ATP-grasp superfamily ATP-dependent carboligase